MTIALSGDRSLRELTELADKMVKVQLERSTGRRRGAARRRPPARDQHLGRRRPAGGLPASRSPPCATRSCGRTPTCPGGNVTAGAQRGSRCARWAASPIRAAFNDLVVATVNGAPVRVRDIGHAEDGTKEQRSVARLNGVPTVILEVRRQSGANTVAVIEARQGERWRGSGRSSRRT